MLKSIKSYFREKSRARKLKGEVARQQRARLILQRGGPRTCKKARLLWPRRSVPAAARKASGGRVMPKKAEQALKAKARKLGLKGERADRYVYGALRKMGWKPKRERRKA